MLPLAALIAASIFGQVTVNETMTARYVAPALRTKLYSIRFTIGFLGAATASPLIGFLHEATGSLTAPMLVLAGFGARDLLLRPGLPEPAGGVAAGAVGGRPGGGTGGPPGGMPGAAASPTLPLGGRAAIPQGARSRVSPSMSLPSCCQSSGAWRTTSSPSFTA